MTWKAKKKKKKETHRCINTWCASLVLRIVWRRAAESFGAETVGSSFCSRHAPTNRSDLTGNTNKVIPSHQAAAVNRFSSHRLLSSALFHTSCARGALHVRSGLKKGGEGSAYRAPRSQPHGRVMFQEMRMSFDKTGSFSSVLLPSCPSGLRERGGLSADPLKKHLGRRN